MCKRTFQLSDEIGIGINENLNFGNKMNNQQQIDFTTLQSTKSLYYRPITFHTFMQ
jgi:hypothetical protein